MDITEVNEVIEDLEKEKSDREFEETFNRERIVIAGKLGKLDENSEPPLRVHFKRPPKTSEEAIETLKEADMRFELNKKFLAGTKGTGLIKEDTHALK